MAFRTTPQLGPNLEQVLPDGTNWFDNRGLASPQLGTRETGSDGKDYIFVEASANIAALSTGREVAITEPAFTAATGSGGFFAPANVAIVSGQTFWARKGAAV